jgi:hypothetical protein
MLDATPPWSRIAPINSQNPTPNNLQNDISQGKLRIRVKSGHKGIRRQKALIFHDLLLRQFVEPLEILFSTAPQRVQKCYRLRAEIQAFSTC